MISYFHEYIPVFRTNITARKKSIDLKIDLHTHQEHLKSLVNGMSKRADRNENFLFCRRDHKKSPEQSTNYTKAN